MQLNRMNKIFIILGTFGFLGIALLVMSGYTKTFDEFIYSVFISFKNEGVTSFFKFITNFGGFYYIAIISVFIYFFKHKEIGQFCMLNIILNSIVNNILKFIFMRDRPLLPHLVKAEGYSFPSGHAMMSFAFYGLIIYFAYTMIKTKMLRNSICIGLSILIVLVGMSRIYLGVHYPSDVLAGFLVSAIYLLILIIFIRKKQCID